MVFKFLIFHQNYSNSEYPVFKKISFLRLRFKSIKDLRLIT